MGQKVQRQRETKRYFSMHPKKQFQVNDHVLISTKRHSFHKNSAIFYPTFENETFVVRSIDRRFLPWTYKISRLESNIIVKHLYGFEMQKIPFQSEIDTNSEKIFPVVNDKLKSIRVNDIIKENSTNLRSGRIISGKEIIFYRIEIDNKLDIVTRSGLKIMQRAFGNNSLKYSKFFDDPNNKQYII